MLPREDLLRYLKDQAPLLGIDGCYNELPRYFAIDKGRLSLDFPDGAKDLMIFWWREDDKISLKACHENKFKALKIREKISLAVTKRIEILFEGTKSTDGLLSQCLWPSRLPTLMGLIWDTADQIWLLCGDQSLDENHYSKRAIVQMMILDLWQVRSRNDYETMNQRLITHIDRVMAFETFKRNLNFSPTQGLTKAFTMMAGLKANRA
jgi:ubiquinone biosynthesis protein COQ9